MSAPWWIVTLVFLALMLLILDLIVPSAGALLLLSLISAISAIVIAFQYDYYWGMGTLIALFAVTPWLVFLAMKIWPNTFIGKMIIRARPDSPEEVLPDTEQMRELKSMIKEVGEAETNFFPSGTVLIRGKRFDANSRVGYIAKGTVVEVLAVHLGHLVVVPCDPTRLNSIGHEKQAISGVIHGAEVNSTLETEEASPGIQPKVRDWSLDDERLLNQTLNPSLDQSLEGIDLSSDLKDEEKRS